MKTLVEGKEQTVALTEVSVADEEIDEIVDIGDFEDVSDYEQAKREAKMEIAARKRKELVQQLNANAEALRKELLRDRPLELELITFAQIWRCMHECEFACTDVPLAAINRLILPPSMMLANQRAEIAAGRDFRAGYKAMLRWVTQMGSEQQHSTSTKGLGSFVGVVNAAKAATQKTQYSVPLCTILVQTSGGKARGGVPQRDRSPDQGKPGALYSVEEVDVPSADVPTILGNFSHRDEEMSGKPLVNLEARRLGDGAAGSVPTNRLVALLAGKSVLAALGAVRSPYGADDISKASEGSVKGEGDMPLSPRTTNSSFTSKPSSTVSFKREHTDSLSGTSKRRILTQKGPTLETLIEAEEPHSPYAVGFAHQRSRVMDFFHFVESIIRISHALYYNPKWDNTVAWCLGTAIEQHMPVFREAVHETEVEEARRERAQQAAEQALKDAQAAKGGDLQVLLQPLVLPTNIPAWQIQMADVELQELLAARQSRLMKIFLHFGTDVSEVPIEARLPGGPIMCFNEFVKFLSEADVMDAKLDTRRVRDIYQEVTGALEVVASVHKNNANAEMIYDEFLEVLVRCAAVVKLCPKEGATLLDHLRCFLDEAVFRFCAMAVPGKF